MSAEVNACLFKRAGEVLAQIVVEPSQRQIGAIDQSRLHAQTREEAGEFNGDITGADDRQTFWQGRQIENRI